MDWQLLLSLLQLVIGLEACVCRGVHACISTMRWWNQ